MVRQSSNKWSYNASQAAAPMESSTSSSNHHQQCRTSIIGPGIFAYVCLVYCSLHIVGYSEIRLFAGPKLYAMVNKRAVVRVNHPRLVRNTFVACFCIIHTYLHNIQTAASYRRSTERVITSQTNACIMNGDWSGRPTNTKTLQLRTGLYIFFPLKQHTQTTNSYQTAAAA